jgi:alpha-tubulin suppressor-like RCC1 family protein
LVSSEAWASVDAHKFHTCAVREDQSMYCWGRAIEGQLGIDQSADQLTPAATGQGRSWVAVKTGRFHGCARDSDGIILCTGENSDGELGIGNNTRPGQFTPIVLP